MMVLMWVLPWALSDVGPDLLGTLEIRYALTDQGSLIRIDGDRVAWARRGNYTSLVSAPSGSMVLAMDEAGRFSLFDEAGRPLLAGDTGALGDLLGIEANPSDWDIELVDAGLSLIPGGGGFPRLWITEVEAAHPRLHILIAENEGLAYSGLYAFQR